MTGDLYLLQYGDFTQLSRAEAYAYISKNGLERVGEGPNYLVFRANNPPHPYFGSIVRFAQHYSDIEGFLKCFGEDIEYLDEGKVKWSLYLLGGKTSLARELVEEISDIIKKSGKKSIYVSPSQLYFEEGGISLTKAVRTKLSTEGYEFILLVGGRLGSTVWRTIKHLDLKGFRERDLGRPYQNPLISMPPWLARSMINLASPTPGEKLLDPFCGTGTILLEALDSGLQAYGVDINPANVEGAKANVEWFSKRKELPPSTIINADTRFITQHFPENYFDLVVTEPSFGPPLKKPASRSLISQLADELAEQYSAAFAAISAVLKKNGKIVFTFPAWRLETGGLYELRADRVLGPSGLTLDKRIGPVDLPIKWSKPDNVIQRLIYIARKQVR